MTFKNPKQYNSVAKDLKNVDHRKNKKIYMENKKLKKMFFKTKFLQSKAQALKLPIALAQVKPSNTSDHC